MSIDPVAGLNLDLLQAGAIAFAVLGAVLAIGALIAFVRLRLLRGLGRALVSIILLALAMIAGGIALGLEGYRSLTAETLAARIAVRPIAPQRFEATLRLADGRTVVHELAGDELYVDAHILKWKSLGNLVGLRTVWALDRVAGRYQSIEQERTAPRTVHSIAPDRTVDLFELRRRHARLSPLFDAEYGSAAFLPVTGPVELELKVSASGLLLRALPPAEPPKR